jgi:predicted RNase H-like nuclease (RuvC/YqgF family)
MASEIESFVVTALEDEEEDPVFTPEEGFRQSIRYAIGYKREVSRTKQKMEALVTKHDEEIREWGNVVREHSARIRWMESAKKDQDYEILSLREQLDALRKEFESYKKAHPV